MLTVTLRFSFMLAALLLFMHGVAIGSIWLVPVASAAKIAATICLVLSLLYAWRHSVLRRGVKAIQAMRWQGENEFFVQGGDGLWQEVELLPSSFVSAYLVVLNLRMAEERLARYVVILPDGIEAEQFRQLRVNLRWKYRPTPG
jgi:toxin CptA